MKHIAASLTMLTRRDGDSVTFNIVTLVCIVVGSAVGLTLATLAIIFLVRMVLKRRHKREMADLEKKATIRQANIFHNHTATVSSPHLRTSKFKKTDKELRGWDALVSNEDLHRKQGDQWDTEIPYPRLEMSIKRNRSQTKRSKRDSLSKRNFKRTQLSAVIESPRSQQLDLAPVETKAEFQAPNKSWSPSKRRKGNDQHSKHVAPPAFEPWPLLSGQYASSAVYRSVKVTSRTQSTPTMIVSQLPKDAVLGHIASRPTAHLRSWSGGSRYPSVAPIEPPPPLPKGGIRKTGSRQNLVAAKRRISDESLASSHSTSSSILGNNSRSNFGAAEPDVRCPGIELGPQKHVYLSQLKTSLAGSMKSQEAQNVGSVVTISPVTRERHAEILNTSKVNLVRNEDSAVALNERYIQDGENGPKTPNRRSVKSRVLENGSPISRGCKSTSQAEYQNRDETHVMGTLETYKVQHISGQNDHLQGDRGLLHKRVDSVAMPSAMKGSPSARRSHKRQNCVRIEINPTVLGIEYEEGKGWKADEMAEELDIGLAQLSAPKWATASNFGLDHQESSSDVPKFLMRQSRTISTKQSDMVDSHGKERDPETAFIPSFPSPGVTPHSSTTWTGSKWGPDSDWEYSLKVHNASSQSDDLKVMDGGLRETPEKQQQMLEARDTSLDSVSFHTPPSDASVQQMKSISTSSTLSTASAGEETSDGLPSANKRSAWENTSQQDQPTILTPESPSYSHPLTPQGQQATQDVMNSVKALRRMNSEIMDDSMDCTEGRRYLGLGAARGPGLSNSLIPGGSGSSHEVDKPGIAEELQVAGVWSSHSTLYDREEGLRVSPL